MVLLLQMQPERSLAHTRASFAFQTFELENSGYFLLRLGSAKVPLRTALVAHMCSWFEFIALDRQERPWLYTVPFPACQLHKHIAKGTLMLEVVPSTCINRSQLWPRKRATGTTVYQQSCGRSNHWIQLLAATFSSTAGTPITSQLAT